MSKNKPKFFWLISIMFFSYPFNKVKIYDYKNIDFKIIFLTPFLSSYPKFLLVLTFANMCLDTVC